MSDVLAAQILLAWLKLLTLHGDLAKAEPKTLRRLLHPRGPAGARRTAPPPENPGDLAMGAAITAAWQRIDPLRQAP